MKIAYAYRRGTFYPHHGTNIVAPPQRRAYLEKVKSLGFDAIELNSTVPGVRGPQEDALKALRDELDAVGLPCAAVRAFGGYTHPRHAARSLESLKQCVRVADQLGSGVVNTIMGTPARDPNGPGTFVGETVSQNGSRTATVEDFERTAKAISEGAKLAADHGVAITLETHQHSIIDNSWSALRLLELIDLPNVGVNPDLGNIYWTYYEPEETCEDAILTLAPHAKYWHCKNLYRVAVPELERAVFLQVPIPDGEIDYRFAVSALREAGYDGYIALEGLRFGDQFHNDERSCAYFRSLIKELNVD